MQEMRFETAIKKAKEGYFQFQFDAKVGINFISYQTPTGKWKEKQIYLK